MKKAELYNVKDSNFLSLKFVNDNFFRQDLNFADNQKHTWTIYTNL